MSRPQGRGGIDLVWHALRTSRHVATELAKRVRDAKDQVLALWEERARQTIPNAERSDHLALLDGMPDLIEELVDAVTDPVPQADGRPIAQASHKAFDHARHRATDTEFSLDEVVREYEVLRKVLFEVLERPEPLSAEERDALLAEIETFIRAAATEFARIRESERERSRTELRSVNEGLERTVQERTAELKRTEARFRNLVIGVRDYAIFTVDPQGFVTSWNEGAQRMKQYTNAEIINCHFSILYTEQGKQRDEPMTHLRVAAIEGRFRGEGLRVRKDGEKFLADVLITPMYEGEVLIGFSKVVQDLTERSSLLQERDILRVDADRLRAEAEERQCFVMALSHDLRSPLSAAKTGAQLLARDPSAAHRVADIAKRISDAVDRADRMIVDLLDASRIDAGQGFQLELQDCDFARIAHEVAADFRGRHGQRFVVFVENEVTGFWDPEALRRILDNLLSNAVKYGDPAGPITIRLRAREDRRIAFVHNFGPSISMKDQARLFQPFHRTPSAESSGKKGWGLGLTLVRGLVQALHGEVMLASYPNEGTTITVDLPADPRSHEPTGTPGVDVEVR